MTPLEKAWHEWVASEESRACFDTSILVNPQLMREKLFDAFTAAWKARGRSTLSGLEPNAREREAMGIVHDSHDHEARS